MAFTEFCCRSGGSNLNAGTRTGNSTVPGTSADFTYASGNWVQSTGVFTVASGNPSSDGVAVGDFASVYADGSTVTGFVGRVTARDATTITVSLSAKAGSAPTDGTGNRTLKIGGAWKGPNGSEDFPFDFVQSTLRNSSDHRTRVNFRNDANYDVTAAMQIPNDYNGVTVFQGFSSSYGDLGKATIDGGTSGSSYILLQIVNCLSISFLDLVFQNNGATGTESGVRNGDGGNSSITTFTRCVFKGMKGSGVFAHAGGNFIECEAYDNVGIGFELRSAVYCRRCISHDNGSHGFSSAGFATKAVLESCASFKNGGSGIGYSDNSGLFSLRACDFYDNVSHGVDGSVQNFVLLENCNFVKNGGYGLQVNSANAIVFLSNCGFGSGTQANTSGTTNIPVTSVVEEIATVTYASDVTPWANPDEGDFRITLAAAKNAGRGAFTLTDATYDGGTVGYPDIGAVQHEDSGGALLRPVNLNGGLV